MIIVPTASVTIGGQRYDQQIIALTVRLATLPAVGDATVTLPAGVRLDAAAGDDATVDLGDETVLTGTVTRITYGFDQTTVELADAGALLAALRPAATYSAGTAADVVSALIADAGAAAGDVRLDLPLAAYVADQTRTAGEHLARLTALAGGLATVDGTGAVAAVPRPTEPTVALKYGRDFTAYRVSERAAPAARLVAVGAGPAGAADAPDALRPSTDPLTGDGPDPGPDAVWRPEPVLRTPTAASTAGTAADDAAGAWSRRLFARCVPQPALRPGAVLDVRELPGQPAGPWLLTRVTHVLTPPAGHTDLDGVAASAGGTGGFL